MGNISKSPEIYTFLAGVFCWDTMDFSPVVFDVFLHGASNEIIKNNKKKSLTTKKMRKTAKNGPFWLFFAVFKGFWEIAQKRL